MGRFLQAGGALALALVGHWVLGRVRRRAPVRLARAAGGAASPPDPRLARRVTLLVAPLQAVLWVGTVLVVVDAVPALHAGRDAVLGGLAATLAMPLFETDGHRYALSDVLALPALLVALWLAVTGLVGIVKARVLEALGVDRGAQEAAGTILRLALTTAGAILVLQVWGIELRTIALAASVLGVGIGFGLQGIANDFVSGLLIGLERPVKPGDFVEVGGVQGTVERVGSRSTVVRTLDEVTMLVPNAKLLAHDVVNWSHAVRPVRLRLPVGVAYGSSVTAVRAALLEAARGHPAIVDDPRPRVELRGFGPSALEFELHVWTRAPRTQHRVRSDLNYRLVSALRRHRVAIPFPQHDVHLHAPPLERALAAWLPGERLASDPVSEGQAPDDFAGEPDARAWSDADLARIAAAMRGPGGVEVRDRRHRLVVYRRCFVGSEGVRWLAAAEDLDREGALALGQALVERGFVHHVLDEHGFRDGPFFYRFRAHEAPAARDAAPDPADVGVALLGGASPW